MNRALVDETGEYKSSYLKQEMVSYGYDASSINYSTTTTAPTSLNQPLPGQPPLPPMPPPQAAAPPPPSVYGAVPTQVPQIHAWTHPAAGWPWISQQVVAPMPTQNHAAAFQREMPIRNTYVKRERYNHNRNSVYPQRGNFHRKNKRRFEQSQGKYDQASFYGAALTNNIGAYNEALQLSLQNQLSHMAATVGARKPEDSIEQDIKEEVVVVKKNKQRKPMSQSYPTRPWIREDAIRAIKIENEFNKTVKAQSLIIKFPDPDLNKEIVREFHSGIQNIHFQSPSGPRYCFIQMAENVDIDEAIKKLEKIPFGVGHLKVERKSLRDEDNPTPEEIDPYTLYIGNLPESVNVNEVKNKFPSAARVDVGYAQKMRNTRYAFIRYNTVDESIAAYKQAHDLMWDTRSIIVRFRRNKGNTCLPGEQKINAKKSKDTEKLASTPESGDKKEAGETTSLKKLSEKINSTNRNNITESSTAVTSSERTVKNDQATQKQPRVSQLSQTSTVPNTSIVSEETAQGDTENLTVIKEEPLDYDEQSTPGYYDDDDDDDDDDSGGLENYDDDSSSDYEDLIKASNEEHRKMIETKDEILLGKSTKKLHSKDEDHLDTMFSCLESSTAEIDY